MQLIANTFRCQRSDTTAWLHRCGHVT